MVKVGADTAFLDNSRGRWLARVCCPLVCGELMGEVGTWKPLDLSSISLCRLLPSSSALWNPRILERNQAGEQQECGCPSALEELAQASSR